MLWVSPMADRKHARTKPVDRDLINRIIVRFYPLKISQAAFAARIGCTPGLVSQWFNYEGEPSNDMLKRVAAALGTTVSDLRGENLTPEQVTAERRQNERIVLGGSRLAELLEAYDTEELIALLEAGKPESKK